MNTKPTEGDFGWFAGLVDGDGCISIQRVQNRYYSVSIIVVNKKPENVLKLMRLFGGSLGHTARRKPCSYVNASYYRWVLKATDEVYRVLVASMPHMAEKRERAVLALELCDVLKKQRALRTYKNREVARAKMDLIYLAAMMGTGKIDGIAEKQVQDERPARDDVGQALRKE